MRVPLAQGERAAAGQQWNREDSPRAGPWPGGLSARPPCPLYDGLGAGQRTDRGPRRQDPSAPPKARRPLHAPSGRTLKSLAPPSAPRRSRASFATLKRPCSPANPCLSFALLVTFCSAPVVYFYSALDNSRAMLKLPWSRSRRINISTPATRRFLSTSKRCPRSG